MMSDVHAYPDSFGLISGEFNKSSIRVIIGISVHQGAYTLQALCARSVEYRYNNE